MSSEDFDTLLSGPKLPEWSDLARDEYRASGSIVLVGLETSKQMIERIIAEKPRTGLVSGYEILGTLAYRNENDREGLAQAAESVVRSQAEIIRYEMSWALRGFEGQLARMEYDEEQQNANNTELCEDYMDQSPSFPATSSAPAATAETEYEHLLRIAEADAQTAMREGATPTCQQFFRHLIRNLSMSEARDQDFPQAKKLFEKKVQLARAVLNTVDQMETEAGRLVHITYMLRRTNDEIERLGFAGVPQLNSGEQN